MRASIVTLLIMVCWLAAGCAGDTYAPVSDRGERDRAAGGPGGTYEVVRGDTLYAIAFRHGLNHRDLAEWNNIRDPNTIYPGQTLRLSPRGGQSAAQERRTARAAVDRPAGGAGGTPPQRRAVEAPRPSPQAPSGNGRADTGIEWLWPTDGEVIKTFSADADGKQGINIGGSDGQPVRAAAPGRVVYSGSGLVGYGNLIIIKHAGEYLTAYGYNSELLVNEGSEVERGQTIARMGRNGGRSMLHFELRQEGRPVDPVRYLPGRN